MVGQAELLQAEPSELSCLLPSPNTQQLTRTSSAGGQHCLGVGLADKTEVMGWGHGLVTVWSQSLEHSHNLLPTCL